LNKFENLVQLELVFNWDIF